MSHFNEFIKVLEVKNNRLKGKFLPISEYKGKKQFQYNIKAIYCLKDELDNRFHLIKLVNPEKTPKYRFFLSIILAHQSSDLIVLIAKDLLKSNDLMLIQYPLNYKLHRLSLIGLKEVKTRDEFFKIKQIMKEIYIELKHKLIKISEKTN